MNWLLPLLGALGVGGLLGTLLSQFMTGTREKAASSVAFRKQQLEQFYGPLLAMHKEIRSRSELRVKLQNAIDEAHLGDMLRAGPGNIEAASDPHLPAIINNIKDESATFSDVLMPRYREMITVFREKMWLAEKETRQYFPALVEFVDVWDKILDDRLPRSVAPAIGHTESNLKPFYEHLEEEHDRLRALVS
jgi:hypothetical protein